jgi:enoyl-[acyl-carrier-protein] reductase (NADH)
MLLEAENEIEDSIVELVESIKEQVGKIKGILHL